MAGLSWGSRSCRLPALLAAAALTALAQSPPDRIWEGIFTAAQAERGKAAYLKSCSNCHIADLNGSVRAPSLKGERFMSAWLNTTMNSLYRKVRDSMPATYPETVADDVKLDIITYLLSENGFPPGKADLKVDEEELERIPIVKQGARGVPNFALVQVVGCLEQGPARGWRLTRASDPAVTREDTSSSSALEAASGQPLGSATFLLVSAATFRPEAHAGEKVETRGLFYSDAGGNRLNVTSLRPTGRRCPD